MRVCTEDDFWNKVQKGPGCWEWGGCFFSDGYGACQKDKKTYKAHRASYEYFYKCTIPIGMLVCHRCDNKACVRPDHLFLGSHLDNNRDRDSKNRGATGDRSGRRQKPEAYVNMPKGEAHKSSKLTESDIRKIRYMCARGGIQWKIAEQFSICQSHVSDIVNFKKWGHIVD